MKNKATDNPQDDTKVLGDINPRPEHSSGRSQVDHTANDWERDNETSMDAGPNRSNTRHSGSRDVGAGLGAPETSGTRNMRSTGGATGSDLGNRPE